MACAVWIATSCGQDAPVQIRRTPPSPGLPKVETTPLLRIGDLEGDPEYELMDVVAATRTTTGEIVVADRGTHNIRFFDARGRHIRSVGRNGEGPGEYRMLTGFFPLQNGYVVQDPRLRRITVLDAKGKTVRTLREPVVPMLTDSIFRGIPATMFQLVGTSDSMVVMRQYKSAAASVPGRKLGTTFRDTFTYVTARVPRRDGEAIEIVDTVARSLAHPQHKLMRRTPFGASLEVAWQIHFAPRSEYAIGASRVYVADSDSFVIDVFEMNGTQPQTIREARTLEPVSSADRKMGLARLAGTVVDENRQKMSGGEEYARFYYENMPIPATKPARGRLLVDAHQRLWVNDYDINEASPWWTIYSGNGSRLGRSEVLKGLRVLEIGADYVIGLQVDEMDVQMVTLFRLAN